MRILQLVHVPRDPNGGAAGVTLRIAEEWRAMGHDVTEFYGDELTTLTARRLREEHAALAAARIGRAFARRVDVISASGHLGWLLFPILRRSRRRPLLVATSFGLEHADHRVRLEEAARGTVPLSRLSRMFGGATRLREVQRTISTADLFVGLLQTTCAEVVAAGWKRRTECLVSPCGVPDEFLCVDRRPDKPWEGRILWCGTTVERKGWLYFASAMKRLATMQEIAIEIVGSLPGDADQRSAALSAEWGCPVRVHPELPRSLQAELIARADVFVSASLSEGFHRALAEAMAVGVPCIATPTGFVADLEQPSAMVRLVPFRDPTAIVHAVRELTTDGGLRRRLAIAGRALASGFRWDEAATAQADRYEQARGSVPAAAP